MLKVILNLYRSFLYTLKFLDTKRAYGNGNKQQCQSPHYRR